MKPVARIQSDFPEKFGIPRQSGLVDSLVSRVVFEPEYQVMDAVRGLEDFSHIWLIWEFSEAVRDTWSPTVRPPRLGGNVRMGVFATRSPFRPNPIGLSCVKLLNVEQDPKLGPVLTVLGADLMDGTPIYDIKPYISYADCHPEAFGGFTTKVDMKPLSVSFPEELLRLVSEDKRQALIGVLEQDPRPRYQKDPERVYGLSFADYEVRFSVKDSLLTVVTVQKIGS